MDSPLGNLISRGEGGYNSYNRGTRGGKILTAQHEIDFSLMTISELQRRQRLPVSDPDRVFAVGKYQIIPSTLQDGVNRLGIDPRERFTPLLQERLFSDYLVRMKRPEVHAYIAGHQSASLHAAQQAICEEWASVDDPDTPGRPYRGYAAHGNRSSIRASEVASALDWMRTSYAEARGQGIQAPEAWRLVTGQTARLAQEQVVRSDQPRQEDAANPVATLLHEGMQGDEVRALQEQLRNLGYRDMDGLELKTDGDFQSRTRHAVQSLQRAHGIAVDGKVGEDTREALRMAARAPQLSHPGHPHQELYRQALHALERLPGMGSWGEVARSNAAASLAFEARVSGLGRIDHVVANVQGTGLFAVQGGLSDPAHRRVYVDREQAARQPVSQSSEQLRIETMATQGRELPHGHAYESLQVRAQQQHVEQRGMRVDMRP